MYFDQNYISITKKFKIQKQILTAWYWHSNLKIVSMQFCTIRNFHEIEYENKITTSKLLLAL